VSVGHAPEILEGRIPDGMSARPARWTRMGLVVGIDMMRLPGDSLGRAEPTTIDRGRNYGPTGIAEWCRPRLRGPRRQSNIKRGTAREFQAGVNDRVTERKHAASAAARIRRTGFRSAGCGRGVKESRWPLDSARRKESRNVGYCSLPRRHVQAFPLWVISWVKISSGYVGDVRIRG